MYNYLAAITFVLTSCITVWYIHFKYSNLCSAASDM